MAMREGLIGRKKGMTQVFGEDGNLIPVTVVEAGPCTVVGLRTKPTHGYDALQLGYELRKKNVTKPMAGLYKKAGLPGAMRVLREIRLQKTEAVSALQDAKRVSLGFLYWLQTEMGAPRPDAARSIPHKAMLPRPTNRLAAR